MISEKSAYRHDRCLASVLAESFASSGLYVSLCELSIELKQLLSVEIFALSIRFSFIKHDFARLADILLEQRKIILICFNTTFLATI